MAFHFDIAGNREFSVRVNWSQKYDASTNSSVVTITSIQAKSEGWYGFLYYPDGILRVNGQTVLTMDSVYGWHHCSTPTTGKWYNIENSDDSVVTCSTTVIHDDDGSKSIDIELVGNRLDKWYFYTAEGGSNGGNGWSCGGASTIQLETIPTYTLSISAGTGSTITVSRTSSGYSNAKIGNLSSGSRLYTGDRLKVTFSPKANYRLLTTKVNGVSFQSGNTHVVSGNVNVASTAQVLASVIGATDANIESTSTITVTKYNSGYYHSLQYQFGDLSGYINSSGVVQSTEVKFQETSIAFNVPTTFYAEIPNKKSGTCTITCRTYATASSTAVLGSATTCTFTAQASSEKCSPVITATVTDDNLDTRHLTGNASMLIRYRSSPRCTITATSKNSSTITKLSIGGTSVTPGSGNPVSSSIVFRNTDKTSFTFTATDSRGYTSVTTISPIVVAYVVLTCNPIIERLTPTGKTMTIDFSGNMFRGSFGGHTNKLAVQYRYKPEGGSYSSWKTIASTNITFGVSSYKSNGKLTLDDEFDYQKAYEFQVKATDGADDVVLTTVQHTLTVQKGIPVFDWGEDDFNVNGDLRMNNVSLLDIIYPVGSVYTTTKDEIPEALTVGGMLWEEMPKIGDVYCWKRVRF